MESRLNPSAGKVFLGSQLIVRGGQPKLTPHEPNPKILRKLEVGPSST
jgi:hypothetical protein